MNFSLELRSRFGETMKLIVLTFLVLELTLIHSSPVTKKVEKRTAIESIKGDTSSKAVSLKESSLKFENIKPLIPKLLKTPSLEDDGKKSKIVKRNDLNPVENSENESLNRDKKSCHLSGSQPSKICLEVDCGTPEMVVCQDDRPQIPQAQIIQVPQQPAPPPQAQIIQVPQPQVQPPQIIQIPQQPPPPPPPQQQIIQIPQQPPPPPPQQQIIQIPQQPRPPPPPQIIQIPQQPPPRPPPQIIQVSPPSPPPTPQIIQVPQQPPPPPPPPPQIIQIPQQQPPPPPPPPQIIQIPQQAPPPPPPPQIIQIPQQAPPPPPPPQIIQVPQQPPPPPPQTQVIQVPQQPPPPPSYSQCIVSPSPPPPPQQQIYYLPQSPPQPPSQQIVEITQPPSPPSQQIYYQLSQPSAPAPQSSAVCIDSTPSSSSSAQLQISSIGASSTPSIQFRPYQWQTQPLSISTQAITPQQPSTLQISTGPSQTTCMAKPLNWFNTQKAPATGCIHSFLQGKQGLLNNKISNLFGQYSCATSPVQQLSSSWGGLLPQGSRLVRVPERSADAVESTVQADSNNSQSKPAINTNQPNLTPATPTSA